MKVIKVKRQLKSYKQNNTLIKDYFANGSYNMYLALYY